MSIWHAKVALQDIAERSKNTMVEHLGIEFIELGDDFLIAKMPVDHRTKQPAGIMHGGSSCVLAETVGSIAGNLCVDWEKKYCVGLNINTNHIKMAKAGFVIGIAKPINLGRMIQIWEIRIKNDHSQLVSLTTLTLAVLDKKPGKFPSDSNI
jgi:1,4-dihydroxy-2-naphthoyl-CoA hydrolase